MIYEANAIKWRKGDLVLEDCDAKEPKMLMRVIGYTKKGLCKTQYIFKDRKRRIMKIPVEYLHDPEQWLHGAQGWQNHTQKALKTYQLEFERVRRWNRTYQVGQSVMTTSTDGGFITTTATNAVFEHGYAGIWLKKTPDNYGGWWYLEFVKPQNQG